MGRRAGRPVDTLSAMVAEVLPAARTGGLAAELLRGMGELAARHGLRRVIAPVRPSCSPTAWPLTVDRAADVGACWQPNVWMIHRELRPGARASSELADNWQ